MPLKHEDTDHAEGVTLHKFWDASGRIYVAIRTDGHDGIAIGVIPHK